MLRSHLYDYSDAYIVVKENIFVTDPDNAKTIKQRLLKIIDDLSTAFQKLMA